MKNFYIFRHGETDMNKAGFIQGQLLNPPLNKTGITQITALIPILAEKNLEIIHSSTLIRAHQTAEIIANALNLKIIDDEALIECRYGDFEGKAKSLVKTMFQNVYDDWEAENAAFPNGETRKDIEKRVISCLEKIAIASPYSNIGIATHGGIIRTLGLYLKHPIVSIPNGTVVHLEYSEGVFEIKS